MNRKLPGWISPHRPLAASQAKVRRCRAGDQRRRPARPRPAARARGAQPLGAGADGRAALGHRAQVLGAAVVGLQAGVAQNRRMRRQRAHRFEHRRAGATPQRPWPMST
jgi:hypothetical protein